MSGPNDWGGGRPQPWGEHEDEYDALARQFHESIGEGQSLADTAKMLRILAQVPSPESRMRWTPLGPAPAEYVRPSPDRGAGLTQASERLLRDFDRTPEAIDYSELSARLWLIEREAARAALIDSEGLDVRRVAEAITNVARRHGITKDPPPPLAHIYGYTRATPDMDAEIAAEYARLAGGLEG